ncbi:MAG: hypothetical protein M1830_007375 [Pleopsidium flavum]|nr:MAG: hypothetical protein M1830_007375 [Pleopsidium flavum]
MASYAEAPWNLLDYPGDLDLALNWSSWFNHHEPPCLESKECGTDCTNARTLFSDQLSFINCVVYPNISRDVSQGIFPDTGEALAIGFENDTALANNVTLTVSSCLIGFCDTISSCKNNLTSSCSSDTLLLDEAILSAHATRDCWYTICSQRVKPTANPDIAGVGITVSYIIQSSIAILGLLSLNCFQLYKKSRLRQARKVTSAGTPGNRSDVGSSTAVEQIQILVTSLVEFHKAQCFFAMAVQIATLVLTIARTHSVNYIEFQILLIVSSVGILPVAYTLWGLSLAIAFSPRLASNNYSMEDDLDALLGLPGPEACGFRSPAHLCAGLRLNSILERFDIPDTRNNTLLFPGLLVPLAIGLTVWQLQIWRMRRVMAALKFLTAIFAPLIKRLPSSLRSTTFWRVLTHIIVHAIFGYVFIGQYYIFSFLLGHGYVDLSNWGFGQIVGITIWCPSMVEFLYLQINGIEIGSQYRLAEPLVVREEASNEAKVLTPGNSEELIAADIQHLPKTVDP